MGIKHKIKTAIEIFSDEGLSGVIYVINKKIYGRKIYKKFSRKKNKPKSNVYEDVLFINGCDPNSLPHPYRYRVLHQMEQLQASGFSCSEVFYTELKPDIIYNYRIFIFYRCPYTDDVEKAIKLAKSLNKKVLFDIDDLVIDTKYTDLHPYVKNLNSSDKTQYDDCVVRMGKTLKLCDGAITTTEGLAQELKKYVPEVFINRNRASDEMFDLSEKALRKKPHDSDIIKIGYFSGSITHNHDFDLIMPVLIKILKEFKNVKLLLLGELDLPDELKIFNRQIEKKPFVDWKKLPELIASVDINLAPIEDNIFNNAKSENKWVEASLVKVPTIASDCGAFNVCIKNEKTGVLCKTIEDWYINLKRLITDKDFREYISCNAYAYCRKKYNTITTGHKLASYLNSISNNHVGFVLPSTGISGGIMVAFEHALLLRKKGYDVDIIAYGSNPKTISFNNSEFKCINIEKDSINTQYQKLIATFWETYFFVLNYTKTIEKYYLVQGYETAFYPNTNPNRTSAEITYCNSSGIKYITISKWCEGWLRDKYGQQVKYAPNGIAIENFIPHKRNFSNKIRILIEGHNASFFKNVDEAFKIAEKLDKTKYEIWYMSYNAKPKDWYRVDRFLSKVPYEKVSQIYEQCDILIKTSILESFSFPPLEMMATGGYCIVVPNEGNLEYLVDNENCLFYEQGNISQAIEKINQLVSDEKIQDKLYKNGLLTAKSRNWKDIENKILDLYLP